MMNEPGGNNATDIRSDSVSNGEHGQQLILRLEQPKEAPWKQPAVYIAILALIVSLGGEWRRWVALDDQKTKQHDYYEEINVWETDNFNRSKDIDAYLNAHFGVDAVRLFGKPKPPPIPKGN